MPHLPLLSRAHSILARDKSIFNKLSINNNSYSYLDNSEITLCKQILIELENSYTAALLEALKLASSLSIPLRTINSKKFWWDVELSQLKAVSCSTHAQWVTAGRPRSGPIFVAKTKAKAKYKNEIRKKKSSSINQISDNLRSALLGSSQQSFWKIWNSNFKTKT